MSQEISFTLNAEPVPWGRPRARVIRGRDGKPFASFYTDPDVKRFLDRVKMEAKLAMLEAGLKQVFDEALLMVVEAHLPIPASYTKKKRDACLAGVVWPTKRPDVDNLCKGAMDACNEVIYRDDSLACAALFIKRYALEPCLKVTVRPIPVQLHQSCDLSQVGF